MNEIIQVENLTKIYLADNGRTPRRAVDVVDFLAVSTLARHLE
jgi:hypothetical protein